MSGVAGLLAEVRTELESRLPAVSRQLAEEVLRQDAAYAELVGPEELRRRIRHNLHQALDGMLRHASGHPVDLADAAATGRHRAGQGLPLASLLYAYRRGGRLMWETLVEVVSARDPARLPELLPGAGDLWEVLDLTADAIAASYRETDAARAERDRERRYALLDALLDGSGVGAGLLSEAAAQLGLPERGRYAVVAVRGGTQPPAGAGASATSDGGLRMLRRPRADLELTLVALRGQSLTELARTVREFALRAGISPVVGSLAELGRARWLAELALRSCAGDGPALLDDHLPAALLAAEPELAHRLGVVVLGPVLELPYAERETLLTTLAAWLTEGGSATAAAGRLYCHRNTVLNRIRRLERLTGRTLADPRHLVELSLAATAVGRLGAGAVSPAAAARPH
ncbi:PucR family transcriptional regulator [Kitasatospora sp. McL0602]|uniref:PucR family transcriptional regulator n=1 Tax=Kitasatospora sp. McL0602 TaxID=3439530 RepID=UPI003F8CE16F